MEKKDCFIVGLGASAGGAEALFELFGALPADINAAYVVVRHLKRDAVSYMPTLLKRYTAMEVITVNGGETVTAGKVYLMPADKKVTLHNRSLQLQPRPADEIINTAIDTFFVSLGKEGKDRAIGVILSGTGTDGVQGVKVIEDHGGIVIVQDPATAQFGTLPQNTIHLDHPDYVMAPRDMPALISDYIEEQMKMQGSRTGEG